MMSDDSENDGVYVENYENDVYYKKYKLLLERCEALQKYNERLVFRIQEVKKITKKRYELVQFMRGRLSKEYGEEWKEIPKYTDIEMEDDDDVDAKPTALLIPKEEKVEEHVDEKPKFTKKGTKRKSTKTEKDPNAPKRPSNPFFQFCQEQRQILMEELNSQLKPGEQEPSKQELTRQLALKWKSLTVHDKQVYVDMYERSKEKYAAEMTEYNLKK